MFKVVKDMTEAATHLFPRAPLAFTRGRFQGMGFPALDLLIAFPSTHDTPRIKRTDPVIGSVSDRF
jgi:hypothetical protein